MSFDVRYQDFAFKHSYSQKPDLSEARFREHFHTLYELLFFVEGDADFMLEHKRFKIRPGSLHIVGSPYEAAFRYASPTSLELY